MAKSVKKNFLFSLLLTLSNYVFPLITYPYVSRVLGVTNIGICNFVDGIINYFVLISMLGINAYGVREIAKCRDDIDKRNRVFTNLFVINIITTSLSLIALIICTYTIPTLAPYKNYLFIGILKVLFQAFLIEWFFKGLQDFEYVTKRSIFIRTLYVIGVFAFIHSTEDTIYYYALTVGIVVLNAIFNWNYSKRMRSLVLSSLSLKDFIGPVLIFGYYMILTSMYNSFNLVYLGFACGDTEVGYFSTATKLYTILMGVFSAFTAVMVPKVSELLSEKKYIRLQEMANKTFKLLSALSLPMIYFCVFCSHDIILILSGPGYEGAELPFRIVIFLLLIIGMEQIVIQQFLMAADNTKPVFLVSTVGAITGVTLNLLLTKSLGAVGSAISWGTSEFIVLLVGLSLMKKNVHVFLEFRTLYQCFLWSLIYLVPLIILYEIDLSMWYNLLINCFFMGLLFLVINTKLNKNETIIEIIDKFTDKIKK